MDVRTALRKKADRAKSKKGFTLVELVIVIAVLAIIAFIAIPTVSNVIGNANKAADNSNAQAIETAIKTAQSEVAANTTNESKKADTLIADSGKTLEILLSTYGVSPDNIGMNSGDKGVDALKQGSSYHFYYDGSKVYADMKAKKTTDIQLSRNKTIYAIDGNNDLTLSATT